jgi:Na+/proline symporter
MLFRGIITLYRENHTKRVNTLNGVKSLIINMITVLYTVYRLQFLIKYVSDTWQMFPSQFGPLGKATLDPWTLHLMTAKQCAWRRSRQGVIYKITVTNLTQNPASDPHFATPVLSMILPYCAVGIPQVQVISMVKMFTAAQYPTDNGTNRPGFLRH